MKQDNKQESIVVYLDWIDNLSALPPEDGFAVVRAMADYKRTGALPELSPEAAIAFQFIRQQLDRDGEKWEAVRQARSEAGKKGGAPLGNQNARKQAKQANQPVYGYVSESVSAPASGSGRKRSLEEWAYLTGELEKKWKNGG